MKKAQKIVLNTILLILLENLYYVCNTYPKTLLESLTSITFITLFNILFWIVYNIFLINIFTFNMAAFSVRLFKDRTLWLTALKKMALLLTVQLLFDAAVLYLSPIASLWKYTFIDILTVIHWIVIYFIATYRGASIWKHGKALVGTAAVVTVLMTANFLIDYNLISRTTPLLQKHQSTSPYLEQSLINLDYFMAYKLFITCLVFMSALVIFHSFCTKDVETDEWKVRAIARIAVQAFVIYVVLFIVQCGCELLLSKNLLVSFQETGSSHMNYEADGDFNTEESSKFAYRLSNQDNIFIQKKVLLYKQDLKPEEFILNTKENIYVQGEDFYNLTECLRYSVNGQKVYLYGNYAICFYIDGKATIVRIEELNNTEGSPTLTSFCQKLLEDGNLFIFEYGYDYLLNNAEGFINPYIARYAEGNFTADELEWLENSFYQKTFIIDLANSISK